MTQKEEAECFVNGSFAPVFYMDRQKEECERGVRTTCTMKEFYTKAGNSMAIDVRGHRDFLKYRMEGAS